MPSPKDPTAIVNPGPGKVPAGTVPASALLFPPGQGGGGAADLQAHIDDPLDAHMASAIGINPTEPGTGIPILSSAGGDIDGENVLDFLLLLKTLLPSKPDRLGYNAPAIPNSGRPTWTSSSSGGFRRGTAVIPTRHVLPASQNGIAATGMVYPADRGVLALYRTTAGDYFNAGQTTLVGALGLGATAPSGIPSAGFSETHRNDGQSDYVPSGAGLDIISLEDRYPYLNDYTTQGNPYLPFSMNFPSYQLGKFGVAVTIGTGDLGSYLLVHWKDVFATSLAAIQPVNLTSGNFGNLNVFNAVLVSDFDSDDVFTINRHNVFKDTLTATPPAGASWTTTVNGSPTVTPLSGVQHYTGAGLSWTVDIRVNNLFSNSFYLGTVANPPNLPTGFTTDYPPIRVDWGGWGGSSQDIAYYQLKPTGGSLYSITAAPAPGDQGQYTSSSLTINAPTSFTRPGTGYATLLLELSKPYQNVVNYADSARSWLYNSFPQSGGSTASTTTLEPMVDEKYRYISTYAAATTTVPLIPAGGNVFSSATVITSSGPDLQVIGSRVIYPRIDYSGAAFRPVGQPNYAAVLAADPSNHIRRYVRAFNTGIARNTGKLRIAGLAASAFDSSGAYTGNAVTDHPNGAIVEIKVPGVTGWLDLGRVKGDPDLTTADGRGCRVSSVVSGSDLIVTYDTTGFTANNGSGQYLLFVRVSLIKGTGTTLYVDELEWLAPLAFIPWTSARTHGWIVHVYGHQQQSDPT